MPVRHGTSSGIHYWEEKNGSIPVATVEVTLTTGKKVYMTVQVLGVSDKFTPANLPVGTPLEELEEKESPNARKVR